MILFRPTGKDELKLILKNKRFPPRLSGQPFFYPVIDETYAIEIARDWNTIDKASGFEGHVLSFEVDDTYITRFSQHQAGGKIRREYWIPSELLEEFNNYVSNIILVHSFIKCPKCDGEGWLWWFELDSYDGPACQTGEDDTHYACDKCRNGFVEETM